MEQVGGCRLTAVAGSGGFAVTYVGEHPDAGAVAVKVLSPNWANDINVAARFEAECDKLAAAPALIGDARQAVPRHIAHGVDHDPTGDRPYLVTELCRGGSLAQRLPLIRDLPLDRRIGHAAWVVAKAAAALAVVHDRLGVVHRDLSPGNLLFRRLPAADHQPAAEELVIGDFGLMKEAALQSNFSRVLGTGAYAAPEVRTQGLCDHHSDVYSLGVVAWELITGQTPQSDLPLGPLDVLEPGVPTEIAALVAAMTNFQRDDRPDLSRVIDVLAPHATTPPPAPPDDQLTTPLPADGTYRRRRLVVTVTAIVALLGLTAGALAWRLGAEADAGTAYTPATGGFTITLDDQWTDVETSPDNGTVFTALNRVRKLALVASPFSAGSVDNAMTFGTASVLSPPSGAPGEVLDSTVLNGDRGRIHYRIGDTEFVDYYIGQLCGVLLVQVAGDPGMTDDTLAYLDGVVGRVTPVEEIQLPQPEADLPDGWLRFDGNGVSLATPSGWAEAVSDAACLLLVDATSPGRSRSASVTFEPASTPELRLAADTESITGLGGSVVDSPPPVEGTGLTLHTSNPTMRTERLDHYVAASTGVFVVSVVEVAGDPWDDATLADLGRIATTLRLDGSG